MKTVFDPIPSNAFFAAMLRILEKWTRRLSSNSYGCLLRRFVHHLCPLEQLSMTPSEIEISSGIVLSVMPPPRLIEDERAERGVFRVATSAEARFNKSRAIAGITMSDVRAMSTMGGPA